MLWASLLILRVLISVILQMSYNMLGGWVVKKTFSKSLRSRSSNQHINILIPRPPMRYLFNRVSRVCLTPLTVITECHQWQPPSLPIGQNELVRHWASSQTLSLQGSFVPTLRDLPFFRIHQPPPPPFRVFTLPTETYVPYVLHSIQINQ